MFLQKLKATDRRKKILHIKSFDTNCVVSMDGIDFGYNVTPVLQDVSLKVNSGDYMAIIGPNGAAKSTLIKIMLGLLSPKTGSVKLFGQDVSNFHGWHEVGYVSQQAGMINTAFPATVEEIVSSGYYLGFFKKVEKKKARLRINEVMDRVGISHISNKLIGELSGGERQKVFLAKALVKNPKVLFLDEPTTGLDAASTSEFYNILSRLNKIDKITIVIVTHDIWAVFEKASKIACVSGGRVFVHENTQEVTEQHIAEVLGYRIGRNIRQCKMQTDRVE
ncbi:MAG: metal ABC transporter ATP-binding protein [Tepidanaerobacteraceae bacterium]